MKLHHKAASVISCLQKIHEDNRKQKKREHSECLNVHTNVNEKV